MQKEMTTKEANMLLETPEGIIYSGLMRDAAFGKPKLREQALNQLKRFPGERYTLHIMFAHKLIVENG